MSATIKILIAEDNEDLRELLVFYLSKYYHVISASDGEECIEKFKLFSPKVILMDILMPKVSGIEATREIRKISNEVVIIAVTAYAETMRDAIIAAGVNTIIKKPFEFSVLLETIYSILETKNT